MTIQDLVASFLIVDMTMFVTAVIIILTYLANDTRSFTAPIGPNLCFLHWTSESSLYPSIDSQSTWTCIGSSSHMDYQNSIITKFSLVTISCD